MNRPLLPLLWVGAALVVASGFSVWILSAGDPPEIPLAVPVEPAEHPQVRETGVAGPPPDRAPVLPPERPGPARRADREQPRAALELRGRVVWRDGQPAVGALVEAVGQATRTSPDGAFLLAGISPTALPTLRDDQRCLVASSRGPRGWWLVAAEATELRGVVVGPAGEPLDGAEVSFAMAAELLPSAGKPDSPPDLRTFRQVGARGEIALKVPADTFGLLEIRAAGHTTRSEPFFIPAAANPRVWTLQQARPSHLEGHVVDAEGQPVDAALVRVGTRTTCSDQAGRFALELHGDVTTLEVSRAGVGLGRWTAAEIQATRAAQPDGSLRLVLPPFTREFRGALRDAAGRPLAGYTLALLRLRPEGGSEPEVVFGGDGLAQPCTGADGSFELYGAWQEGFHVLRASTKDSRSTSYSRPLDPSVAGGIIEVHVQPTEPEPRPPLPPSGRFFVQNSGPTMDLRVRVRDPEGNLLPLHQAADGDAATWGELAAIYDVSENVSEILVYQGTTLRQRQPLTVAPGRTSIVLVEL